MSRHSSVNGVYLNIILSILSILISFAFIAYGLSIWFASVSSLIILSLSAMTLSYGVIGFYCIYQAFKSKQTKAVTLIKYVSFIYLAVYFAGSLDSWRISGHELLAIFTVSIFLLVNWLLIKSIFNRRLNA